MGTPKNSDTIIVRNNTQSPFRVPLFDVVENKKGEKNYDKTDQFWLMIGVNSVKVDMWAKAMEVEAVKTLLEKGDISTGG